MKNIFLLFLIFIPLKLFPIKTACVCSSKGEMCKTPIELPGVLDANQIISPQQQFSLLTQNLPTLQLQCPNNCYPYTHVGASINYDQTDLPICEFEEIKTDQ
ncbi:MAG: hypothetical protein P4L22_01500 [Candidatus Babeliales bacterium]|nr:hypothetical protein [Candidatus Babeliales bacterium]